MKIRTVFCAVVVFWGLCLAEPDVVKDACVTCHEELDEDLEPDEKIMTSIFSDIHFQKGLSCADCHGGDPEAFDDEDAAMWDDKTFRGEITKSDQPELCGNCHNNPAFMRQYSATVKTDQLMQYWTSKHGEGLKKGVEKVAVCTDCHGIHGIFPVKDPRSPVYPLNVPSTCSECHNDLSYMSEFGIPTDQYFKYRNSVHGTALLDRSDIAAPACNDCHGNHGALPPNVVHITDICGTCHVNNSDLFQQSHLKDIFLTKGFGQCEACHGNHGIINPTDEYLNWEHGAVCVQCHKEAGNPKILADLFYTTIDSLKNQISLAERLVTKAERIGMEVSDLYFPTEEAHQALIQTRTSIHSFNKDFVQETADVGFKSIMSAIQGARIALKEYDSRRKWLFLLSLIMTFFAVMMYLKIKEIDKRH